MRVNCIIVEDEPLAMERTRGYVQKLPFLNLAGTFDNSVEAISYLAANPVELIFLDVNLGEISGIQLLETAKVSCEVVITTAYNEYALKGFELNVTDYLLKPFTFERFLLSVNRVQHNLAKRDVVAEKKFIFVKTEYRLEKLMLHDLMYIEGMRDYRKIHTTAKKIMTLQTFAEFELEIPPQVACRVHKSFMVAPDKIDSIERDRIKIGDVLIPISESYRKTFFDVINHSPK